MRVLIVDDERLFLDSISYMISQIKEIQVVGTVTDIENVLSLSNDTNPDLVLMDVYIKNETSLHLINDIKNISANIKVLVMSSSISKEIVKTSIAYGANGIISKDIDSNNLINVLKSTYQGHYVFDKNSFETLQNILESNVNYLDNRIKKCEIDFNEKEMLIITKITQGKSTDQIADEMHYSLGTIKNYITRINKKIGTGDKTGIMLYALKNDLV